MYIDSTNTSSGRICLNAAKADTLSTARTINGMQFNGSANINNYGVCSTAAGTKAKEVTVGSDFTLVTGAQVIVKFTNANSASSPTLKVNDTDAKPICQYGSTAISTSSTSSGWRAGSVQTFTYDGTSWVRDYWANTTYSTDAVQCTTAAGTAAKVGSTSYYSLANNRYFMLMLKSANTYQGAITLNINSAGAKPIYINGSASSASNYTLPAGLYLVHYDGTNYYFRTDGKITGSITGSSSTTITATATDDDVVVLTGTNGTNKVTFDAKHAEKGPANGYTSGNTVTAISGSGASGTIKIPQITVDKYGHVTAAADENVAITMPTLPTSLKNPNSLKVQSNGTDSFTYDGSSAKTLNIKAGTNVSVTSDASGNITISSTDTDTTYSAATQSAAGLMSAADKKKLDGVTDSADAVSFTQSLTAGTQVGTITINGAATKLYAPTNTDTHYTTGLKVTNSATATANAAASNGSVYINTLDDTTIRDSHLIKGTGAATVTSDANGAITINATNTTYSGEKGISLNGTKLGHSNTAITAGSVGAAQTPSFGGTFAIPKITYDAYGHITAATTVNVTLPNAETDNFLPLTAGENKKLTGPLGLTKNVMYGTTLPTTGFDGQLFFLEDDSSALPVGGTAGQVLVKKSATDGDASWITQGLALTGDVSGSGLFDSTGNLIITTTVADDSHNHTYLLVSGREPISSPSNDTIQNWSSKNNNSTWWYGADGCLADQPSTYGFIQNFVYGSDVNQIWFTQSGGKVMRRSGNASGWNGTWRQFWLQGDAVTGAVWNDYAECRESDCEEFGYVLMENGDDTLSKTTERLSHFAGISSDTWGFSQGETDKAKTPIAVAGRVLTYTYQDRNNYKPGDCVCAAPGGTVDIMTREEVINWPDRIVGTVSCVPDYEEWGGGEGADRPSVKVDNRIWIKVR